MTEHDREIFRAAIAIYAAEIRLRGVGSISDAVAKAKQAVELICRK